MNVHVMTLTTKLQLIISIHIPLSQHPMILLPTILIITIMLAKHQMMIIIQLFLLQHHIISQPSILKMTIMV